MEQILLKKQEQQVMWMLLVLVYGVLKGCREVVKKKSLQKNTVMEVLFLYTLLSFLMVTPQLPKVGGLSAELLLLVALKAFVIFVAWICSFKAIKQLPISYYGILDLSRVLFATLLGVFVLQETLGVFQVIGLILVCSGLLLLKYRKKGGDKEEKVAALYVAMALLSCMLNAVSGLMDKLLMKRMSSENLQFFYMLFLVLFYAVYILVSRTKIRFKSLFTNYWIWLLSLMFVVADRALFIANGMEESRVTVMTLIKQSGCIVTILAGKFIFHEKNIGYKLFCAAVIVCGIVIAVL